MSFEQSTSRNNDEYEFLDENEFFEEDFDQEESDEDTEEASETEQRRVEPVYNSRDAMYQDKMEQLNRQLKMLEEGTLPEYRRRVKRLEQQHKERLRLNTIWKEHMVELAEKDYIAEKRAAAKEFDERSSELRETIVQDLEERRKIVESEKHSMELAGDSAETKPAMTRKLRRRPNDPAPLPEKRRGKLVSVPSQISYLLDEKDIESDLKAITRGLKTGSSLRKPTNGLQALGPIIPDPPSSEIRIEDGKLLYERKWFHRGQTIFVEGKDLAKFPGVISAIGSEAISVKKVSDSSKIKVHVNQLMRGKIVIKRRAS